MTFATGGSHQATYIKEVTFGTTPVASAADPMLKMRLTQNSIISVRDSFTSEELRGDQQISDLRLGAKAASGDINFELSYLSMDDFLEAALGGTWTTTGDPDSGTDWDVTGAGGGDAVVSQVAGTDLTTLVVVGDFIRMSGWATAGNNGTFEISVVTDADTITVLDPSNVMVNEAVGATVVIELLSGATLKSGLGQPSFTIENQYNDVGFDADSQFLVYEGMTVNTLSLTVVPNGIVTGAFGFIGEAPRDSAFSTTSLGASFEEDRVEPSPQTSPMDAFSGQVDEGATSDIMTITSIELTLTRNLNPEFVIGKDRTVRITPGRNNVTGTVTAFFEDKILLEKFLAETESSLKFTTLDTAGNQIEWFLPRVKYTGGDNSVTAEGAILVSLPFQALLDDVTENTNIRLVR